jgi:hypothetical protein
MIDRTILLEHQAQAERHVAQGRTHLARQEALIADLERDGHDTKDASAILTQHVLNVGRLLKELQQHPDSSADLEVGTSTIAENQPKPPRSKCRPRGGAFAAVISSGSGGRRACFYVSFLCNTVKRFWR